MTLLTLTFMDKVIIGLTALVFAIYWYFWDE